MDNIQVQSTVNLVQYTVIISFACPVDTLDRQPVNLVVIEIPNMNSGHTRDKSKIIIHSYLIREGYLNKVFLISS